MIRNVVLFAALTASCSCSNGFPTQPPQVLSPEGNRSAQQAWEKRVEERIPCLGGLAQTAWPSKEVVFRCPSRTVSKAGVESSQCRPTDWSCDESTIREVVE